MGTANDGLAKLLYLGTMALSSTLLALIAVAIGRDRNLRDTDAAPDALIAAGTAVTFLLALGISVAIPATSYWPLLLLLLTEPVLDRARRARVAGRKSGS